MAIFIRGEANNPTQPKLQLFVIDGNNSAYDVQYVSFRIVDITTEKNKCHYSNMEWDKIQVYPLQGAKFLDISKLVTDIPPGHKIAVGNYYAPWTAEASMRVGEFAIIWEWKDYGTSPFKMTRKSFAVKES